VIQKTQQMPKSNGVYISFANIQKVWTSTYSKQRIFTIWSVSCIVEMVGL